MKANMKEAFSRIDNYMAREVESVGLPGLALAITDTESIVHAANFGFADLTRRRLVDRNTRFEIGSISKSFASVVLLQLVENGLVNLHKPLKEYLPWFRIRSEYEPITPHHLLTHTAGIPCGTECTINAYTEALELRSLSTSAPPGTYFHYSNTGYKIIGLLIESILWQPNAAAIKSRILDPLGMASSEASLHAEVRKNVAIGYTPSYDDRPAPRRGPLSESAWVESDTADGSIVSTSTDMSAYVRLLLNKGKHPSGRIISEKSFGLLTQKAARYPGTEPDEWYGYGLAVRDLDGHMIVGHSGGMLGFVGYILMDIDLGMGIVMLMNGLTSAGDMAKKVLATLRACAEGKELPKLEVSEPRNIDNASDYAGSFESSTGQYRLVLKSQGNRLLLDIDGRTYPMERREEDEFFVEAPGFELFLTRFSRSDGKVMGASHGPTLFTKAGVKPPRPRKSPSAWSAYVGHYRTHDQWLSNFRIIMRNGALFKVDPSGKESPLIHIRGSEFREGPDQQSPETVKFDTLHNGKAMRVLNSGCPCYRTFTV